MTEEKVKPRIGTLRYVYEDGTITSFMFGANESGEPTWCMKWQMSDPEHVGHFLEMKPGLAETGILEIY